MKNSMMKSAGSKLAVCGGSRRLRLLRAAALLAVVSAPMVAAHASDPFVKPTREELEMTSLSGYPGAPAVVLFREEITKDDLHQVQRYERLKVLTEEGKKYANVELKYVTTRGDGDFTFGNDKTVDDIQGRTIHPDGTIIPFTGKPYLKVIVKDGGAKLQEKVFTLPDVEVGSIIEYRYSIRYNDYVFEAPEWFIQDDLYVKAAHFQWFPTTHDMLDGDTQQVINSISWFPILPAGAKIERTEIPSGGPTSNGPQQVYNLVVKDVPPTQKEDFMPPIASFSYRVLFSFTPFRTSDEFWKAKGKAWSKRVNNFADANSDLAAATQPIIVGAATQDDKLRKIYATIMTLENTNYTRERDSRENKAAGIKLNHAIDVLTSKRGNADEITELFVGMARSAGMKAYAMLVPDRSEELFTPLWMSFSQFDDLIAVVTVDGKEEYFDPGSRYCAYGHLAWEHTNVQGLRQVEGGTNFATTSGEPYPVNKRTRVANLNMDEHGQVTGKIDLTYIGSPALHWRQEALRGDDESLRHSMRQSLEEMLPKTLEVKVADVQNLDDYEKPLMVLFEVKGSMGTVTGKRLMLPADVFLANSSATFPHEKRDLAVYFSYPQMVQDAMRVNFPKGFTAEAVPTAASYSMPQQGVYKMVVTSTPTSFTAQRAYAFNSVIVLPADYPALRTFYSQFEAKDQESVVLKADAPLTATAASPAAN